VILRRALQERLLALVSRLPDVQIQNRLMATTDRDLALSLSGMEHSDERQILARLSPAKADRVREELALTERRRVDEEHVVHALGVLIGSLEGRRIQPRHSYVRPRRPDRD